ncbi:MAG: PIN domain-containing protein [Lentisphaeria bacterium]|jgi:predicted nucleic acid-binding protein|nr:PIN domain-containing protein [Lentisphaeria bacterium]
MVINLCKKGIVTGLTSILIICMLSYIMREFIAPEKLRQSLRDLRNILRPIELSVPIIDKAIDSPMNDFEDAVQFYTAVYSQADYIITRNLKYFPQNDIPIPTPTVFLEMKENNQLF